MDRRVIRRLGRRSTAAASTAPRRALPVERAVCLDGQHLWLTLDLPTPGRVLAVDGDTGAVAVLATDVPAGRRCVVLPLGDLPGDAEATFLLRAEFEQRSRPLAGPDPAVSCAAPRSAYGADWEYAVTTTPDGLAVRRQPPPPGVPVLHAGAEGDSLVLEWAGDPTDQLVLTADGADQLQLPTVDEGARVRATVSAVPELPVGVDLTPSVRRPTGDVPLMRDRNDLPRPNIAVLMPEVDSAHGTLALRWVRGGGLRMTLRSDT